jgi:hypothetical protein
MRDPRLTAALLRNRQRLALERLTTVATSLLPSPFSVVDAVESAELDRVLRADFARHSAAGSGTLQLTDNDEAFAQTLREYFAERGAVHYSALLANWTDAGAIVFTGDHLARHALELVRFDGDTLYGCMRGGPEVFSADISEVDGQLVYELFSFNRNTLVQ